jgi:serine/threonine protein kinase
MNLKNIVCVSVISGPLNGHKFFVKSDSPILIGRCEEATIKIDYDDYCSRKQAAIYWDKNICLIEDLNSTNGTFVNEKRIYGKKELHDKDIIGMGNTKLVISVSGHQENIEKENALPKYAPGRAKMEGKIEAGDFIGDDFDIYQVIEGGMGIVYICYNNKDKNIYALKTIKKYDIFNDDKIQKENQPLKEIFKQEAYSWMNLGKHPYIVRAYTVQRFFAEMSYPSKLYIIMEYVTPDKKGRNTLAHYLGDLAYADILRIAIQFCCGMEYAYSKGIKVHRDIKPNNIMVTPDLTVKITDFGIAKSFDARDEKELIACGTLPYMAPEQFDGTIDKRGDIYSFGIVLYQLVTGGSLPFLGKEPSEYINFHKHGEIPNLNSPLFLIIRKCLEKNPEKRYKNFNTIQEELQKLLREETGQKFQVSSEDNSFGFIEWLNKGRALDALHKYEEAVQCYDKGLAINPKSITAWYWKSVALVMLNKYKDAIHCCDKILEINPLNVNILRDKGKILSWDKKYQDAIICFDKILDVDSDYEDAWCGKKNALYELGKHNDVITWCDEVIYADSNNIKAWCYKADALFNLERYEEAVQCYEKALNIKPDDSAVLADKAKVLSKSKKYKEAIACFDRALEIDEINVPLLIDKIITLIDAGMHDKALFCCNEALEINPECGDALYYKAVSFYKLNKFQDALECVESVLKLAPLQIPKESQELKKQIIQKLKT